MMMNLMNLTDDEVAMLSELLRTRMQDLRTEVRKTDDWQYRHDLLDLERQTQALLRKLEGEEHGIELHA